MKNIFSRLEVLIKEFDDNRCVPADKAFQYHKIIMMWIERVIMPIDLSGDVYLDHKDDKQKRVKIVLVLFFF